MNDDVLSDFDRQLAARLTRLRQEQGLSLDQLAARSGISRATLSRLERGETSPTAALLGRLCTAYGWTLSRLVLSVEQEGADLIRRADQWHWQDASSGFERWAVSPPAAHLRGEMVEGRLPAGAVVAYEAPPMAGLEHHLFLLSGSLLLTLGETRHALFSGDCLRYRLEGPSRFEAPGPDAARYLIALHHG